MSSLESTRQVFAKRAPRLLARDDVAVRFGAIELASLLGQEQRDRVTRHVAARPVHVGVAGIGGPVLAVVVDHFVGLGSRGFGVSAPRRLAPASRDGAASPPLAPGLAASPVLPWHRSRRRLGQRHDGVHVRRRMQVARLVVDDDRVGLNRRPVIGPFVAVLPEPGVPAIGGQRVGSIVGEAVGLHVDRLIRFSIEGTCTPACGGGAAGSGATGAGADSRAVLAGCGLAPRPPRCGCAAGAGPPPACPAAESSRFAHGCRPSSSASRGSSGWSWRSRSRARQSTWGTLPEPGSVSIQ